VGNNILLKLILRLDSFMSEQSHTDLNDSDVTRIKNDTDINHINNDGDVTLVKNATDVNRVESDAEVTLVNSVDSTNEETILTSNPTVSVSTGQPANQPPMQSTTSSYSYTGSFPATPLAIGSLVKNTYELIEVLGEGGMGTVFKAINIDWAGVDARDPYVALKVLKPELSDNKDLVMGLFREFDRTKMLSNCPNNIRVYDFGRDGPNVFMTMEYLTGQTLSEYLNRQPMNLAHAWFIIEGVGNALAFAHEHNIVHRDIKPGNIFITKEGLVKVLDFGIASKINENEDDRTKFNGDDLGAFTLAYASPDTRLGDPPDCRDDIYSFACVIYEILTGKKFFDPKRRSKKAEPIHGLNSKQMDAVNKALAFERDLRTPSIRELLDKLRPVKTPWVKYGSIGGGVVLIVGLLVVFRPKEPPIPPPSNGPVIKEEHHTTTNTDDLKAKEDAVKIAAEKEAQRVAEEKRIAAEKEAQRIAEEKRIAAEKEAQRLADLAARGYSADEVVHLETSQPEYKNGEAFHLSFTLTQPSYVRIIDRDVKGNLTDLRPNPRQPDNLLPANKEQVFPPDGLKVPVEGISGQCTITIVTSTQKFPKSFTKTDILNPDGSISEQVRKNSYSWVQVNYTLR
jgi:serine/threonine protein kinase